MPPQCAGANADPASTATRAIEHRMSVHPATVENLRRVERMAQTFVDARDRRRQRLEHADLLVAAAKQRGVAANRRHRAPDIVRHRLLRT